MIGIERLAAAPAPPRRRAAAPAQGPARQASLLADQRVAAAPSGAAPLTAADRAAYAVRARLDAAGRARLERVRAAGSLAETDAKGASLVANLAALGAVKPPAGAPYLADELVGQVLAHLAEPAVINQSSRNTCGATTVQYVLATEQPAEYARLVVGLAGEGRVALRGGGAMRLPTGSTDRDDTNRDDVERLVQSAFQHYGGDFRGSYANETDTITHANGESGGLRGFLRKTAGKAVDWAVGLVGGARGNAEGKIAELYRDVTGRNAHLVGDLPGGVFLKPTFLRGDVWGPVAQAVARGHTVPVDLVIAGLSDRPGAQVETLYRQGLGNYAEQMLSHQVLVTRIADGRVHYRNPWGYETSLSEAAFRSRLTDAIIPQ